MFFSIDRTILERPSPVQSRLCGWSYLIKFSIGNLSYSPCSEPSHTVLLPDVLYKMYARHAPVLIQFTPLGRFILLFLQCSMLQPANDRGPLFEMPLVGNKIIPTLHPIRSKLSNTTSERRPLYQMPFVENKVIHTLQATTNQKKAFKTANERRPLFEIHWWGTRLSNDLSFLIPNQN